MAKIDIDSAGKFKLNTIRAIGSHSQDGYISSLIYSKERQMLFGSYEYIFKGNSSIVLFTLNETDFSINSWQPLP